MRLLVFITSPFRFPLSVFFSLSLSSLSLPLSIPSLSFCLLAYSLTLLSLLNQEGSLMAFAGKSEKKEHVTAAIAANIWMSYENNSKVAMEDDSLKLIVLNCDVS